MLKASPVVDANMPPVIGSPCPVLTSGSPKPATAFGSGNAPGNPAA